MVNFIRGFRLGRGTIKHSTTLYDEFKPKTQFELDSLQSGNTNFPNTTLSPMDSLRILNSRNNLQDSIRLRTGRFGYKFGRKFPLSPYMSSKDSTRHINEKSFDSIGGLEDIYLIIRSKKKKK